jgi:hypothetical protein
MKFSPTAFTVTFLLHGAVTVLLGLAAFGTAMSSFSRSAASAQDDMRAIDAFSWVWSFGPILLQRVFHVPGNALVHVCWSLLVGVAAGFLVALLWPSRPTPNPHQR